MATIRIKKVPQAFSNQFAFGGNLGTNGADFTDGLTYFNVPTRHETNPNGGIPQGIAPDGQPNLVEGKEENKKGEGGEIKWNKEEYIFSDRLKPTQKLIDKWKLPKSFLELTYADAVRKSPVILEAEQRPNDPKSQDVMDLFLADVASDQEEQKAENKASETQQQLDNMSPEELAQVNAGLEQQQAEQQAQQEAEQQAMMEQQMAQEQMQQQQMPPEMIQQGMPQQGMSQMPMMGAEGGNLHAEGGSLAGKELNSQIPPEEETVQEQLPQEQLPQEQMSEVPTEEVPQDMESQNGLNFDQDAEDMSTNELNAVIDQIIDYATNNNDRPLVRKAKKIKRESREKKEDFVNETLDSIQAKEEQQREQEELERQSQSVPSDQVAAEANGPVAQDVPQEQPVSPEQEAQQEGVPEEAMMGGMFAKGGDLQKRQEQARKEQGIALEDLDNYDWDADNEVYLEKGQKPIQNSEVVGNAPLKKPSIDFTKIPGIIPTVQDFQNLPWSNESILSTTPVYVQQYQLLKDKQLKRRQDYQRAQMLRDAMLMEQQKQQLLGQTQGISDSTLQDIIANRQFALGGNLFGAGGSIKQDSNGYYFTNGKYSTPYYTTPEEALQSARNSTAFKNELTDSDDVYLMEAAPAKYYKKYGKPIQIKDGAKGIRTFYEYNGKLYDESGNDSPSFTNAYNNDPGWRKKNIVKASSVPSKQNSNSPDKGSLYSYGSMDGFKYYKEGKYDQGYADFINNLTDDQIKELTEKGFLKPEGDLYKAYALNRKNPNDINAAMLKDPVRGALDGKRGYKHDYAAALYEAHQLLEEEKQRQQKLELSGDPLNDGKDKAAVKSNPYVIRYTDKNGNVVISNPYDFGENNEVTSSKIEGIFDPETQTLNHQNNFTKEGNPIYDVINNPTPSKFKDPKIELWLKASGMTDEQIAQMNEDQIARATKTYEEAISQKKPRFNTFMRFAPLLDWAEAPDPSSAINPIINTQSQLKWNAAPRHGEYLKYNPVDALYRVNQIREANNSALRGIMNAANGNVGTLMANLAYNNSKGQQALGETLANIDQENWKRKADVITQHNDVDKTYDAMAMQADQNNMSNNSIIYQSNRDAANIMWDATQNEAAAKNATRTNVLEALGNIGRENFAMNQINGNPANGGYGYDEQGNPKYFGLNPLSSKAIEDIMIGAHTKPKKGKNEANGGCLTIKRKRRK